MLLLVLWHPLLWHRLLLTAAASATASEWLLGCITTEAWSPRYAQAKTLSARLELALLKT